MLEGGARSAFVVACGCHAALSVLGAPSIAPILWTDPLVSLAGIVAFIVAMVLGFLVLSDARGLHHGWIKAALGLLVLGPLAFWFLQWPAVRSLMCLDCTIAPEVQARALGDIMQAQWAMIAVALAALFCATRAMTSTLDELAA